MGEFDFTYILPENFEKRVVQYLLQLANRQLAEAFQHCKYEYEDVGLAYYAGLRGDNWNKRALDFTFEGAAKDISVLKRADKKLKDAIGKTLKPSESGFLIRNVVYFDVDVSLEDVASPSSNEERLNCDIQTAKNVLNDLVQIGERVCWNALFNAESSENSINDYFRDMFFTKGYLEKSNLLHTNSSLISQLKRDRNFILFVRKITNFALNKFVQTNIIEMVIVCFYWRWIQC